MMRIGNRHYDEDGYDLWMRYKLIRDEAVRQKYQAALTRIVCNPTSPTLTAALDELRSGLEGLLGRSLPIAHHITDGDSLVVGPAHDLLIAGMNLDESHKQIGDEGYIILNTTHRNLRCVVITARTDIGVLYGVFHLLRLLQTHQPLHHLPIISSPKAKLRMLNHWDNLDGTIERGYAGFSLWDWHKLPDYIAPRYQDYARANASIGINGTVLNNVNTNALILTQQYLVKVAAIANVLRPYGIRVYLAARFSAPIEIGGLETADPLDQAVSAWWQAKAAEIYQLVPDFGGFLVKANSEGQPGPQDYRRSHADGANLLADALAPFGGIVIWRAFVYDHTVPEDRAKQAYDELMPQDGLFHPNVLLQVKNGPVDFQPREPFHPLLGAMPQTPMTLEVQITQEYLGCATHLVYLAPLFKETLDADTVCNGPGSLVAHIIDGTLDGHPDTGMAGVANIGSDRNWCGHPFAAANWFAFGRLAWDHRLTSEEIADEWLRMTFCNEDDFLNTAKEMMMQSREAVVNYMTPLGLHHIMARGHHYGPGPWVDGGRADWTSLYYHRADKAGIGFDRSPGGSDAVRQYKSPFREQVASMDMCPENLLLWFHHVPWTHTMRSGRSLWDELCFAYNHGVDMVRQMQRNWDTLAEFVDDARLKHVQALLAVQEKEARWWRDACLLYFQTFSEMPIPAEYERPAESLEYYMNLEHYFVPGIPETRSGIHSTR